MRKQGHYTTTLLLPEPHTAHIPNNREDNHRTRNRLPGEEGGHNAHRRQKARRTHGLGPLPRPFRSPARNNSGPGANLSRKMAHPGVGWPIGRIAGRMAKRRNNGTGKCHNAASLRRFLKLLWRREPVTGRSARRWHDYIAAACRLSLAFLWPNGGNVPKSAQNACLCVALCGRLVVNVC